jgi:acyl-CoA reductase-like NAD-dependent aldehyde dehydrogenase
MASAACCGHSFPATIRTRPRGAGLRGSPSEGEGELIQRARTDRARLAKVEAVAREQAAELSSVAAQGQAERETLRTRGAADRRQVLARIGDRLHKAHLDLATAQ